MIYPMFYPTFTFHSRPVRGRFGAAGSAHPAEKGADQSNEEKSASPPPSVAIPPQFESIFGNDPTMRAFWKKKTKFTLKPSDIWKNPARDSDRKTLETIRAQPWEDLNAFLPYGEEE